MKNCRLWEGFILEKIMKHYLPWERVQKGAWNSVSLLLEEEAIISQTTHDELTTAPIPHPTVLLWGKERDEMGSQSSEERRVGGKVVL